MNKWEALNLIFLWIMMGVVLFGVTMCESKTQPTVFKNTDYQKCLQGCPTSGWSLEYENLECPRMCAELNTPSLNAHSTLEKNNDTLPQFLCKDNLNLIDGKEKYKECIKRKNEK